MKKPVDGGFKWINSDGMPTQYFLELIQSLSRNGLGESVSITAPTDGQVLKYVAATGLWTPSADNT